jgi:hypothetical protein
MLVGVASSSAEHFFNQGSLALPKRFLASFSSGSQTVAAWGTEREFLALWGMLGYNPVDLWT